MAMAAQSIKPKIKSLDDLLHLNESDVQPFPQKVSGAIEQYSGTEISFELMDDFPNHPFRLYTGQRKDDMLESIRQHGILQPLILRATDNGRYQILAGHNRKHSGMEAGLLKAPAVIKHNLTDEEAMIYVVETNLMQRSFSDMLPSEKAAVLTLHHSKMFSQGKRTDILNEIKMLERPQDSGENESSVGISQKVNTRDALAEEYSLTSRSVSQYIRVQSLIDPLKQRLDNREIALAVATALSFLTPAEQTLVDKCVSLNKFKLDIKKADALRHYSERKKLNEEHVYLILNGDVGQAVKKNCITTVKMAKEVYTKYFSPNQSAKEIQGIVEKALQFYHSHTQKQEAELEQPQDFQTAKGDYNMGLEA